MRDQFFRKAGDVAITAGVSVMASCYIKGVIHSYHSHCEHVKKYPNVKTKSTAWSRFSASYLPLFSFFPPSSDTCTNQPIKAVADQPEVSSNAPGK